MTSTETTACGSGAAVCWADLRLGDCLEIMPTLPAGSVDMVLTDPPYGTTACKWDSVIPFEPMWSGVKHCTKRNAAIVMTASQPFTSALVMSNIDDFAFCWVWDKCFGGNFVQAKRQPIKDHEDIVVFCKSGKQPLYYPQMIKRDKPIRSGGNEQAEGKAIRMKPKDYNLNKTYAMKFPTSQIRFSCREGRGLHPTQKPVELMEYLIKTYSNEGDTVLDFTMGSGTTGVACKRLRRNFIGIELDPGYFEIAQKRIDGACPPNSQLRP